MGYDITDLEQLIDRNGNLTSFAAIQALQYLKTNGVPTNGIHDLKDLVLKLKLFEGREVAIEEAEGKAMEIVKNTPEGEMINQMLLDAMVEAVAKANGLNAEETEKLKQRNREYVESFGAVRKVENVIEKKVEETVEEIKKYDPNLKEETISGIKDVTRIVLNNTLIDEAEREEEPLRVLDEGTRKLAEAEKSLIDPQINLLKEAKKEIILHVEEETGNKIEKKDVEKLFEKSGIEEAQKVMAEEAEVFGDRNIFKIIQTGIKDYYNKKNEAERQISDQVAAELIEHDIPDAEKNKFATLILKSINGASLNDKEKKFIGEIDSVIENNYHTVLYGLIEYEFRTNLALIENEADFAEKIYMRLLQRADVKTKPGLMRILLSHRMEIMHMIVMQVKAYKGYKDAPAQVKGIDPETARMFEIMLRKNELLMKEFKEKNPELIEQFQKTKLKETITKTASEKIEKPTVEEKVAIRNFSDFTAQTYHPTRNQDQNLRVARWVAEYEKRKQAVMQTRGKIPYKIPIVRQMNNLVEYIKSRPFFQYRTPFLRYNIPFVQPHYNMGQILREMWVDMGQSFQSGYSQPGGLFQNRPTFSGGGNGRTSSIPQMINNFGDRAGPAMKGGADNVMKNLGVGPNALGRGLGKLGEGLGKAATGLADGVGKLAAAAFNPVTIQIIAVIVVALIVGLLLYQIFTGNLISSLAPDTAYGGQLTKDDPSTLTPTPGGDGEFGDVCYFTKNGVLMPKIPINNTDLCNTGKDNPICGDLSKSVFVGDKFCSKNPGGGYINGKEACYLEPHVLEMYKKMMDAASEYFMGKIEWLTVDWGYRDFGQQVLMWNNNCSMSEGKTYADYCPVPPGSGCTVKFGGNLAACPGTSNHQSGRTIDFRLGTVADEGKWKASYTWLMDNAKKYGFKDTVPGEKWHFEYVATPDPGQDCVYKTTADTWVMFDDMNDETATEQAGDRRIRPLYNAEEKAATYLKSVPEKYMDTGSSTKQIAKRTAVVSNKTDCSNSSDQSVSETIRYDERISKYLTGFMDELTSNVDTFNQILKTDGKLDGSTAGYADWIDGNKTWKCSSSDFKILLAYRDLKWQSSLWCQDPIYTAFPGQSGHMTGRTFDLTVPGTTRCIAYPKILEEIRKIGKKWGFYATEFDMPDPELCTRKKMAGLAEGDCKTKLLREWWHFEYNPPVEKTPTETPIPGKQEPAI